MEKSAIGTGAGGGAVTRALDSSRDSRRGRGVCLSCVEEMLETFRLFDKNGDGYISSTELGDIMRSMGENPTDSQLQDMIAEYDNDGLHYFYYNPISIFTPPVVTVA